jgi:TetR/AcrR family transcriptional regulator
LQSLLSEDLRGQAFAPLQIGSACNIHSSHTTIEPQTSSGGRRPSMHFAQIKAGWDISAPENSDLPPLVRLREEYATLFRYTVAFPEFHRFMRQEALTNNPRLKWVAETVLAPLLGRLIPQIVAAQKQGLLPSVDPILFHYMMVSLTATLSGFGPEMQITSGLSAKSTKVIEAYWRLVDETVFGVHACGNPPQGKQARKRSA